MCVCVCVCLYISVGRLSLIRVFLTEYDPFLEIRGTLTLPEHLFPHPLQGALNCIGCSLALYLYFTDVVCLLIYGIDYR